MAIIAEARRPVAMLLLVACGSSATTSATPTASTGGPGSSTGTAPPTSQRPSTTSATSRTSVPEPPDQIAVWPATDTVFGTPQAAAADFVQQVIGRGVVLGDFTGNDQRSGEIPVFASDEHGARIGNRRAPC